MPRHGNIIVDETMKNRIYHLYMVENLPLEKVRSTMKRIHDFERTKNEYQKLLHDWRFDKNNTVEDWKSLKRKVGARVADHKKSALYRNMKLLPDRRVKKEFGRKELYLTAIESMRINQEPMPATPPGILICTPGDQSLAHCAFNNLPILKFTNLVGNFAGKIETFRPVKIHNLTRSRLNSTIRLWIHEPCPLASILPTSALINEETATGLGLDRIDRLGPTEVFNLTAYMISNNFPGEANSNEIYNWLKDTGSLDILPSIASVDSLTTKALLEGIFRLAMEAGDTQTVKKLLRLNVDPNGHQIMIEPLVGTFTPLQHACMFGDIELAQALLEAGATVEEDETGWKRSILTIAIFGHYGDLWNFYRKVETRAFSDKGNNEMAEDEDNELEYDCVISNDEHENELEAGDFYCDYYSIQQDEIDFLELIELLMKAGAKVIFRADDTEKDQAAWDNYFKNIPDAFKGCDSPLTAAAKYKRQYLVDKFLTLGADANLTSENGDSPLQQCLFSLEEGIGDSERNRGVYEWTLPDLRAWMLARATFKVFGCENITGVAKSLLRANANPDPPYHSGDRIHALGEEYDAYLKATPLNIAIIAGFEDLVEAFLSAGAKPNEYCLQYAIHGGSRAILDQILDTDAVLTHTTLRAAAELPQHFFFALIVAKRPDPLSQALAVIEAIRLDIAEYIFDQRNLNSAVLSDHLLLLQDAVNHCCSTGRTGVFFRLLDSQCTLRTSLLSTIPSALASINQAHVWRSNLYEHLMRIVENDIVLITACMRTPIFAPNLAVQRRITRENRFIPKYQEPIQPPPTPLHMAVEQGDIALVRQLLEQQASPNVVPAKPYHTPLQIAARDGNKELTSLLLEYGANVNAPPRSDSGATALQFAAIGGYLGVAFFFLDYNVDVNAAGAQINGRTALEGAAEHGRIDMVKVLLNAGVDVYGEGQAQYERALDFASNNGHHAVRQMLIEHHD